MKAVWLALGLALAAPLGAAGAACAPGQVELRLGSGAVARFSVEVADDPAERAQGLMFREHMASSSGMLFIYERPQHAVFWMKNTLIPLDMIFAATKRALCAMCMPMLSRMTRRESMAAQRFWLFWKSTAGWQRSWESRLARLFATRIWNKFRLHGVVTRNKAFQSEKHVVGSAHVRLK